MIQTTIERSGRIANLRRGATAVQVAVLLALVTMAAVAGISQLGTASNTKLNQTATDVATPSSLVSRFGTGS